MSTLWRTPRDNRMLIKSYSKRNKLLYNVAKEIKKLDSLCIQPDEKEKRLEELQQLNHSIAYTSSLVHFFYKEETIVSYVRDQHYTLADMFGNNYIKIFLNITKLQINSMSLFKLNFSKFWWNDGLCNWNVSGSCM